MRPVLLAIPRALSVLLPAVLPAVAGAQAPARDGCGIAIVGATLIDGNGGPPLADATVLIRAKKIEAVGPRSAVQVPRCARVIDGTGKFLTPGFVDTNVHISLGGSLESNI